METEFFEFKYGKIIVDTNKEPVDFVFGKSFVGDMRVSLILNEKTLEKYRCFSLNYRGKDAWRLQDKDFEMLLSRKKKPCEGCDHLKFEKETNALYCELNKDYCEAEE